MPKIPVCKVDTGAQPTTIALRVILATGISEEIEENIDLPNP
jgi:hypothetical protein